MTRAHLVSETHWDREWYLTKEEFRVRLVRLMDRLLDIVDRVSDYGSFMMDGQTIALEDYLLVRPQNEERLRKAVRSGKIVIGPWYVLPDELLISGESHIRNWLAGAKLVAQFGGKNTLGYLPDSFGHPEQMPQILAGLGAETAIFWRGTSEAIKKTEFIWESAHAGSCVVGIHMPYGYGNSARLSRDPGETIPRLDDMIDKLRRRSTTDAVLLMNGSDHVCPQEDLVEIIADYNARTQSEGRLLFSTIEDFVKDLKTAAPVLEIHSGELRSGDRDMVLGGTLSTRVYLKQRNAMAQRMIERFIEPLAALEALSLRPENRVNGSFIDYQDLVWKMILENQPHDSICGCSVDAVHSEMLTRFDSIDQLEGTLLSDAFAGLEKGLLHDDESWDAQCLYFEANQDRLPAYQEFEVDLDAVLVNKVNFAKSIIEDYEPGIDHPALPIGIEARDQYGRKINCALISADKAYYMDLQDSSLPEVYKVNRCKIALLLPAFDYGIHVIRLRRAAAVGMIENVKLGHIENEFYSLEYDARDATFFATDKITGEVHRGLGRVIDLSDSGDEYTHSWVENEREYSLDPKRLQLRNSKREGLYEEILVEGNVALPEAVTEDRKSRSSTLVDCPLRIRARLYPGLRRLDFRIEIDNRAKDHRLQVEIPAGKLVTRCSSSTAFAVTSRAVSLPIPEAWVEYPQNSHPTHGFIHAGDEKGGVSVASDSTSEFESIDLEGQTRIRLTLLRCVGWLSRPDLASRKGNGGWNLPTPGAQCPGWQVFDFGAIYHEGDFRDSGTFGAIDRKQNSLCPYQLRKTKGGVSVAENPLAFVSSLPGEIRLSALKTREGGGAIVLRIYSIAREVRKFSLAMPAAIAEIRALSLDERALAPLPMRGRSIDIEIFPSQILSFELVPHRNEEAKV